MKKSWQQFKEDEPGERFKERYRRRQESERSRLSPARLFNVVVGTILVVGSAAFGWAPGPGILTFFIGLGMIAGEFGPAVRLLDGSEARGRELARRTRDTWKSSVAGKVLIAAVSLVLVTALGYTIYRLFFNG